MEIFPKSIIENTIQYHFKEFSKTKRIVYFLAILLLLFTVVFCAYTKIDVSVNATGVVRPYEDHNEIKLGVGGVIENYSITENSFISKGDTIAVLKSDILNEKLFHNKEREVKLKFLLDDLGEIINSKNEKLNLKSEEIQALYNEYLIQLSEYENRLHFLSYEVQRFKRLLEGKSVAKIELENKEFELEKLKNEKLVFIQKSQQQWQNQLYQYSIELKDSELNTKELSKQKEYYSIIASTSGFVQQKMNIEEGNYVDAGNVLCVLTPKSNLIAEFYVSPNDIGLVKKKGLIKIQSNSYNYNEWGFINGEIVDISNDLYEVKDQYFFKVKCKLAKNYFQLKNGYVGKLKNGMSLQGHINVSERTVLNLLFDDINDWLNPNQKSI